MGVVDFGLWWCYFYYYIDKFMSYCMDMVRRRREVNGGKKVFVKIYLGFVKWYFFNLCSENMKDRNNKIYFFS